MPSCPTYESSAKILLLKAATRKTIVEKRSPSQRERTKIFDIDYAFAAVTLL
jgi:hypothetical protein